MPSAADALGQSGLCHCSVPMQLRLYTPALDCSGLGWEYLSPPDLTGTEMDWGGTGQEYCSLPVCISPSTFLQPKLEHGSRVAASPKQCDCCA